MSVCSTSHADMLYVNRIYVCIVNIKLEITCGLCIPTYLQCPFPSYLCYSAYPSAPLGHCYGPCASWLAQRACEREWEFLIPTSGRTTPTWGGVASPGSIPARGTHRQGHGSECPPQTNCCTYCQIVDMIYHTWVMLLNWYFTLELCVYCLQFYIMFPLPRFIIIIKFS